MPLALSRPPEALARARALLETRPEPRIAAIARQAVGIVLRDAGDLPGAIAELRRAHRLARAAGSSERAADVLATLGTTLVLSGRTAAGLAALEAAAKAAQDVTLTGRIRMRQGTVLMLLGRHREALAELGPAIRALRRAGDDVWEARALAGRANVHLAAGAARDADADLGRAERLFLRTGQELEAATAVHNRALVAFRSGDLPAALAWLDEAARRYDLLDIRWPDLYLDRCTVLLAAGLARDAAREADAALAGPVGTRMPILKRAELLLVAATAALAAADAATGEQRAREALRLFQSQGRQWWPAHAAFVLLEAQHANGGASRPLPRRAESMVADLDTLDSPEAPRAHVFVGRVAQALGRLDIADRHYATAARARRSGPALRQVTGHLAEALRADLTGQRRRVLSACRRGLDILDIYQLTLGATELRAHATAYGAELANLAARHALSAGRPRDLLAWSERWRATVLAVPPVRPPDDAELAEDLVALRGVAQQLSEQGTHEPGTHEPGTHEPGVRALERDAQRLERSVRARVLRVAGSAGSSGRSTGGRRSVDLPALIEELGPAQLLHIVNVDGDLQVLLLTAGRLRRFPAGRLDDAAREVRFARFGLHRLSSGDGYRHASAAAGLAQAAERLEEVLLGAAARHLRAGPLVLIPPGCLNGVPWALLPALRHRILSIAPSARTWLRARRAPPPESRRAVLVLGPGLPDGAPEVQALEGIHPAAAVLGHGSATAPRVLEALEGSWLAHVVAHGTFRHDSPLFSSLELDDGPLTVHDLQRLARAPYQLVLSSCESAVSLPTGADELLGLASSLVPLGTVAIVASVVPVSDVAATPLMVALHERVRRGVRLAEALRDARLSVGEDPVPWATASSFVTLGAG